jgi:hypothetical protein
MGTTTGLAVLSGIEHRSSSPKPSHYTDWAVWKHSSYVVLHIEGRRQTECLKRISGREREKVTENWGKNHEETHNSHS